MRGSGADDRETSVSGGEGKGFEGIASRWDLNAVEEAAGGAGAGGADLGRACRVERWVAWSSGFTEVGVGEGRVGLQENSEEGGGDGGIQKSGVLLFRDEPSAP